MKFSCGLSSDERVLARIRYLESWHLWFAWHPVRMADKPDTCVWLQRVWRRCYYVGSYGGGDWDAYYRLEKPT